MVATIQNSYEEGSWQVPERLCGILYFVHGAIMSDWSSDDYEIPHDDARKNQTLAPSSISLLVTQRAITYCSGFNKSLIKCMKSLNKNPDTYSSAGGGVIVSSYLTLSYSSTSACMHWPMPHHNSCPFLLNAT